MTLHLRPETEARLTAQAGAMGMSVEDYLEALVERELPTDPQEAPVVSDSQFQKEHGIWVYRTGQPMPLSLLDDTLEEVRLEREASLLGNIDK